jgi:hypothetical protein
MDHISGGKRFGTMLTTGCLPILTDIAPTYHSDGAFQYSISVKPFKATPECLSAHSHPSLRPSVCSNHALDVGPTCFDYFLCVHTKMYHQIESSVNLATHTVISMKFLTSNTEYCFSSLCYETQYQVLKGAQTIKVKIKIPMQLIRHHAVKTYGAE